MSYLTIIRIWFKFAILVFALIATIIVFTFGLNLINEANTMYVFIGVGCCLVSLLLGLIDIKVLIDFSKNEISNMLKKEENKIINEREEKE